MTFLIDLKCEGWSWYVFVGFYVTGTLLGDLILLNRNNTCDVVSFRMLSNKKNLSKHNYQKWECWDGYRYNCRSCAKRGQSYGEVDEII